MSKKKKQKHLARERRTKEQRYKRKGFWYYTLPFLFLLAVTLIEWLVGNIDLSFKQVTLKLIFGIAFAFLTVYSGVNAVRYVILLLRCVLYREYVVKTISDYVRMKQGCSGTGKSSSGSHEATFMAEELELMLRIEYWLLKRKKSRTEREEKDWQEVKKAYDYYTTIDAQLQAKADERIAERNLALASLLEDIKEMARGKAKRQAMAKYRLQRAMVRRVNKNEIVGCVWCLWSNIPIRVGNRMSNVATVRHLLQLDCLPKYTVLIWDEIGNTLSKYGFSQTQITQFIEELFRYPRHYNEMRIIMTEQEGNNVLISTRKNIAFLDYFTEKQKSLMRPALFKVLLSIMDRIVEKRHYNVNVYWFVRLYIFCKDMYRNIGFRVFSVMQIGNQEQAGAGKVLSKVKRRVAFATLNCEYDDRCYRDGYKSKDKPINGQVWDKLLLSEQDINEERELRENLLSKPTIELKQELGLKLSNFDMVTLAIDGTDIDYNKVNDWIKKKWKRRTAINKLTTGQVDELIQAISSYKQKQQKQDNPEKI